MKKPILLTLAVICCISIIPCTTYALDITVGASTWYAWGSRYENVQDYSIRNNNNYAFDPTFFYGPAMSVKINDDFNLTFIYLLTKFDYIENVYKDLGGTYYVDANIKRSDSDLALNYRLNNYFKVFAGAKYMTYEIKLSYDDTDDINYNSQSKHTSLGPGFGVSATYPITGNIFLLGTLSGFYLFSPGEKFEDYYLYNQDLPTKLTIGYNEYGVNSTIAVAYYIAQISTVVSLGVRYQYFITDYSEYKPFLINDIKNEIYGITLTATYTFSI